MKDGHVCINRYLRRDDSWIHSNLGGAVIVFDFDNPGDTLSFRYSVCSDEDNFDTKKGLALAKAREATTIPYDREVSLCTNVYLYLEALAFNQQEGKGKMSVMEEKLWQYFNDYGTSYW